MNKPLAKLAKRAILLGMAALLGMALLQYMRNLWAKNKGSFFSELIGLVIVVAIAFAIWTIIYGFRRMMSTKADDYSFEDRKEIVLLVIFSLAIAGWKYATIVFYSGIGLLVIGIILFLFAIFSRN